MRFLIIPLLLVLAGCTAGDGYAPENPRKAALNAEAYCLSKGYSKGGYEFESCYRNRPEIQARERYSRLSNLSIINDNKSGRTSAGKSYPVE